ncbi:hypothetical protein Tco_1141571 [Tanacetum coccineum]
MAYGPCFIRRISDKSAVAVEIDFTWSLGFVSMEPEAQISLMMFEFSSCLLADSAMNLASDSSIVSLRVSRLLLEFFLLLYVDNPLYSVVPCIVRIRPEQHVPYAISGSIQPFLGWLFKQQQQFLKDVKSVNNLENLFDVLVCIFLFRATKSVVMKFFKKLPL